MPKNQQLFLPYALPYLAYVAIAELLGDIVSQEINYALRILVVTGLLLWARRWYFTLTGPDSWKISAVTGIFSGMLGAALWVVLLEPFVANQQTAPWSTESFLLRLFAAGLLVPVFEELMMRGYVFRLALQWDQAKKSGNREALQTAMHECSVNQITPGAWSWPAVLISTAVFAAGHHFTEWPAAIVYGFLMSWLWIYRKDLLSCIVAHAITNIVLALYVLKTGKWYLW